MTRFVFLYECASCHEIGINGEHLAGFYFCAECIQRAKEVCEPDRDWLKWLLKAVEA